MQWLEDCSAKPAVRYCPFDVVIRRCEEPHTTGDEKLLIDIAKNLAERKHR